MASVTGAPSKACWLPAQLTEPRPDELSRTLAGPERFGAAAGAAGVGDGAEGGVAAAGLGGLLEDGVAEGFPAGAAGG